LGKSTGNPGFFSHPILVGGAITILKNMSSSMEKIIPYMKWKIKAMFQTTNQIQPVYHPMIGLKQLVIGAYSIDI